MALQQKYRYQVEVTEDDVVQVRANQIIYEDTTGEIMSSGAFHRHVVHPLQDFSGENPRVKNVCTQIFTPQTVAYHQAKKDVELADIALQDAQRVERENPTPENEAATLAAETAKENAEAALEAAELVWETQYDV